MSQGSTSGAQQGPFSNPYQSPYQLPGASSWTNQGTTAQVQGTAFGNPPSNPPQQLAGTFQNGPGGNGGATGIPYTTGNQGPPDQQFVSTIDARSYQPGGMLGDPGHMYDGWVGGVPPPTQLAGGPLQNGPGGNGGAPGIPYTTGNQGGLSGQLYQTDPGFNVSMPIPNGPGGNPYPGLSGSDGSLSTSLNMPTQTIPNDINDVTGSWHHDPSMPPGAYIGFSNPGGAPGLGQPPAQPGPGTFQNGLSGHPFGGWSLQPNTPAQPAPLPTQTIPNPGIFQQTPQPVMNQPQPGSNPFRNSMVQPGQLSGRVPQPGQVGGRVPQPAKVQNQPQQVRTAPGVAKPNPFLRTR